RGDLLEEGATGNTNIKLCLRKIADGHFTAAVKVLSSSGVAPYYGDTIKALEAKDGLRAQHILDALYGEGSATAAGLLKVITLVVNLWLAGRCPPILAEFVASAPLTSLFKPDNEIRPIVVGTIWRILVFKQCDPLRPLLFALILYPLLHKIKDSCKLLFQDWYLDDRTVIRDSEEVARVLYIIKVNGPGLGLKLNIKKTEIFCPSCNGLKFREGLFPVDIQRPSSGVKLLGGA
nr:putative reverse transcriptase domain-containing protein [Tanacetum cinerariifolium]